jgi:D-glycero-alpha-D-manno-heptose-7-phosphate kinase
MVKISVSGFSEAEYPLDEAPLNHPLGLMFMIATYFRAKGVHIIIDSSSPPQSGLGGSSAAAVALIAAFSKVNVKMGQPPLTIEEIALLAYDVEQSIAGVPCGVQDQFASAYGGVNAWYRNSINDGSILTPQPVIDINSYRNLESHLLLAYCGIPHESKNINRRWVEQFISGKYRKLWAEIIACTKRFSDALFERNFKEACASMNRETAIRRKMTPDVLDKMGAKLVDLAVKNRCGARFTGAGGGGCIWAIGEVDDIARLKDIWGKALLSRKEACLLDVDIDSKGVLVNQGIEDRE